MFTTAARSSFPHWENRRVVTSGRIRSTHVTGVISKTYRLPMPVPWGPEVTCQYLIATTVDSSDGGTGQGFSWAVRAGAQAIQAMIEADIAPVAEGGPVSPAAAWDRLWWHLREAGGGITTLAMAAIDIGLWDLQAKAVGLSLADLLGRQRETVPAYASGVNRHLTLDELKEQVARWISAGHTRVKIKVGLPSLDEDLERVGAVRRILGPGRLLMVDANQLWDLPTARRAARALSAFDIFWLEEPLPAEDVQGYARLRAAIDVPVAAGESLYTEAQFRDILLAGAVDFIQPNVCRVGGITPFLRIARLARLFDVPVMPHLLPDISGQLALCLPLPGMIEDIDQGSFAALGALARPSGVVIAGDSLQAQTQPGHGLVFAGDSLEEITR
jgi:L-alanine-DL-glutamate epimerase-like enolase superfamily enzyme